MSKDNRDYDLRVFETESERDEGVFVLITGLIGLEESIEESYEYLSENECVELYEESTEEVILNFSWEYRENGNKYRSYEFYTEESKKIVKDTEKYQPKEPFHSLKMFKIF
jgi:hypothetical protein